MKLNVRCCCKPKKILGTLEVRQSITKAGNYTIPVPSVSSRAAEFTPDGVEPTPLRMVPVTLKVMKFSEGLVKNADGSWYYRTSELAIYSDDRGVAFWRNIPGFTENCVGYRKLIEAVEIKP